MKAYLEIEMPRCCNKCPMLVYEGHVLCICRALPAIEEGEILKPWKNRRKDCPLIPVPPHGRLIDADEFLKRAIGTKCFRGDYALMLEELVGESATIIPASKEGE